MKLFNKLFLSTMSLFLVFSLITVSLIPKANASTINVERLAGQTAFQTGAAIANAVNAGTVDTVVLTSGNSFPDALSGSVLAKQKNAPILLVDRSVKSSGDAFDYIKSHLIKDGTIYILGGTAIIPEEFETALNDLGYNKIIRRGGWDQYDTSQLIAEEIKAPSRTPIVIAYGKNFPDALSFSSFAANKGWPILLTPTASLPEKLNEYLKAQNPTDVYIAGGTAVISNDVVYQIQSIVPLTSIHRIAGWDQFDTSIAIAKRFALNTNHFYVASGKNFPDALSGSVLAAQTGSPIILIDSSSPNLPTSVVNYFQILQGTGVAMTLLGGTAVVPVALVSKIQAILSGTTAKITIGSSKNDVLKIMGKPFYYEGEFNGSWLMVYEGVATVYLYPNGPEAKVIGWSCYNTIPEVTLGQRIASAPAVTLGSSKEDVVKACGTPIWNDPFFGILHQYAPTWKYDNGSYIDFDRDYKVIGWNNTGNLKVTLGNIDPNAPVVTIGSSSDDVLKALGTPYSVRQSKFEPILLLSFGYKGSYFFFSQDKVFDLMTDGNNPKVKK